MFVEERLQVKKICCKKIINLCPPSAVFSLSHFYVQIHCTVYMTRGGGDRVGIVYKQVRFYNGDISPKFYTSYWNSYTYK